MGSEKQGAQIVAYGAALLLLVAGVAWSIATQSTPPRPGAAPFAEVVMLADFEDGAMPSILHFNESVGEVVDYQGGKALRLKLNTTNSTYAGIFLQPEVPFDFHGHGSVSIAFDAVSVGDHTTQFVLSPTDAAGLDHTRGEIIHSDKMRTYYSPLKMELREGVSDDWSEFNMASGMRSDPPRFSVDAQQLAWLWGTRNLDLRALERISINSMSSPYPKEVLIDNIRIVKNPPTDEDYLVAIVDEFGQAAKRDYPGKIESLAELLAARDTELAELAKGPPAGRSKYGGWAAGPKLEATGFFRTEKVEGTWSLVDPEGYLYLSTGIDVIRRGDTSTVTGQDTVQAFHYGEQIRAHEMKVVSDTRRHMFEWLPALDDSLARHYGYVFGIHSGLLERGVTYDFYAANLERKYGAEDFLTRWRAVSIDRMVHWGFTSLGNWADPGLYNNGNIPYVANRWITGDYKRVSSGLDFWEPLPDVFDPDYQKAVRRAVRAVAAEVGGSPWCMGVFLDNELSFGRPYDDDTRYGIVINTLARDGADVPTKAAFTRVMREKYATIDALNAAWELDLASWDDFDAGLDSAIRNQRQLADYSLLLETYADQYFRSARDAMDEYMPNHLYLGARFADWGMPMEAVRAAGRHADVVSFNYYKEGLFPPFWSFLEELDKPCIIGEFGMGASGGGNDHYGVVAAQDQRDRAAKFTDYLETVLRNPYFVGAHWFQYQDSPLTGRAFDGENYNNGFVSVTDTPYQPMVEAARHFNATMYERKFGDLQKKGRLERGIDPPRALRVE